MSILRAAVCGAALGCAWGGAARAWMRLISTDPEFTWTGTGAILAVCTLGGLVTGILHGMRKAGRSQWWRFLAVLCLPIFAGQGIPFLPAYLFGGLLFVRQPPLRLVGAGAIAASELVLILLIGQESVLIDTTTLYGGFLLLSLPLAVASAEFYLPARLSSHQLPQRRPQFTR